MASASYNSGATTLLLVSAQYDPTQARMQSYLYELAGRTEICRCVCVSGRDLLHLHQFDESVGELRPWI